MGTGYLIVEAQVDFGALPVSGARVEIKNTEGTILHELETDQNGKTKQVSLDTVDRDRSLDPNYTGVPYTIYNLQVEAPGFETILIYGVHIFDGEIAIQPITMIPMLRHESSPAQLRIVMGENAVEMTEERHQVGPLIEPRVLRHVIIPDLITVHRGTPSSAAQNVQVKFPDYVKNVASHEIYPTWPDASLRANIYAIITFALNRIFTVWYRSRGYNFDITNSTAYDQYFVYGGTIYASISKIVDEIFNQFVRRQGQYAPFFTSFCNGTTATCAGLSQWGTVSLANSGKDPLQILRSYYPKDIEIAETNIFTSIIESYPGTALRLGDTGLNVQIIQTRLNRIRRNYPAIPAIAVANGVFGEDTLAAVKAFQNIFNLTVDGIVGRATWYKIAYLYVAVVRLAELDSEGTQLGIGTVPPNSVLSQGSSGMDVITLQYILNLISEYFPVIPAPMQNGIFGIDTTQAVLAFQRMMSLPQNGVVNQATWNALYDTYWGIRNNIIVPEVPEVIQYTVQSGDTLFLLAQRFGTTVEAIKNLNALTSDQLMVGQVLRIPAPTPPSFSYIVQPGDTLFLLAQRFGTTVEAIKVLNNLTNEQLMVGQELQIPGVAPEVSNFSYTVRSGDTLFLLARRFSTTVDEIKEWNGLTSSQLNVGQVLQIPGTAISYIVQLGDTLFLLAQRFGLTVNAIMEFNGLTSTALNVGQVLLIP